MIISVKEKVKMVDKLNAEEILEKVEELFGICSNEYMLMRAVVLCGEGWSKEEVCDTYREYAVIHGRSMLAAMWHKKELEENKEW